MLCCSTPVTAGEQVFFHIVLTLEESQPDSGFVGRGARGKELVCPSERYVERVPGKDKRACL